MHDSSLSFKRSVIFSRTLGNKPSGQLNTVNYFNYLIYGNGGFLTLIIMTVIYAFQSREKDKYKKSLIIKDDDHEKD